MMGSCGKRALGRAEDHLGAVGHVEGRLVARAQQVVRLLLVQRHGATHVGADLRVGDDAVERPVLAARARHSGRGGRGGAAGPRPWPSPRAGRGVSLRPSGMTWKTEPIVTSAALMGVPSGSRVSRMPLRHIVCLSLPTFQSPPRFPMRGITTLSGAIASAVSMVPLSRPRRPTPIPESVDAVLEHLDGGLARVVGRPQRVALLDHLVVAHERLGPVDRAQRRCQPSRGRCRRP